MRGVQRIPRMTDERESFLSEPRIAAACVFEHLQSSSTVYSNSEADLQLLVGSNRFTALGGCRTVNGLQTVCIPIRTTAGSHTIKKSKSKYHTNTTSFTRIPKRIKKVVNTTPIPVNAHHCAPPLLYLYITYLQLAYHTNNKSPR